MVMAAILSRIFTGKRTDIMTEIRFYHLQSQTMEQALPQLLTKAYSKNGNLILKLPKKIQIEPMNQHLWTFDPHSFLPHGSAKDGFAENQPIWLTEKEENPNSAKTLIWMGDCGQEYLNNFDLCCHIFNGFDTEEVSASRARWKEYKAAGFELTYWQQTAKGGWEQKA